MMWPSVADERALAIARRYKQFATRVDSGWKSNGPAASLLFFLLTIVGVAATWGFFSLLQMPKGPITLALAVGLAEWLILKRRFFGTGVESALWLGGLFGFIFGLRGEGDVEALLFFAAATLVAAVRMRSSRLALVAVVIIVLYLYFEPLKAAAFWFPYVLSIVSALALTRTWQRPSSEALFSLFAVVLPAVAAGAGPRIDAKWSLLWFATAAFFLVLGLKVRHHALLIAALVASAIALAFEDAVLYREWSALVLIGGIMLLASAIITRALRSRTTGFVLDDVEETSPLELLATVQMAPDVPPTDETGPVGGGGSFGGAGASGNF